MFSILAAIGSFLSLGLAQTVSTPVVGFNKFSFPAGNSAFTATFTKPAVFSGTATGVTSTTLTVATASLGSLGPINGLPQNYVKIISGPLSGYVFDIVSNTATQVTVDGNLSTAGANPTFIIRPHVFVTDLFTGSTGLTDGLDTITIYNPSGAPTVMLRAGLDSPTGWVSPIDESPINAVVYPGQGFYITSASAGSFTCSGQVESTETVIPLYAGAVNLVSRASPAANSLQLQTLGLGANMSPALDTVEFFSNNGSLNTTSVYLWAGVDGFLNPVDESPAVESVAGGQVMNVTVANDTAWKAPAPYTP